MDHYTQTDIMNLVQNESFRGWVIDPTPETDLFWSTYALENPQQAHVIAQARDIILALQVRNPSLSESDIHVQVSSTLDLIRQTTVQGQDTTADNDPKLISVYQRFWFKLTASFIVILGLGVLYYYLMAVRPDSQSTIARSSLPLTKRVVKENNSSRPINLILPDGSHVTLQPNSRIHYPTAFDGHQREVSLTGEAFFSVIKNPNKPFLVYANELTTKVLGTSFRIRAYEFDKQITVEVKSGKVSVFASKDTLAKKSLTTPAFQEVTLTPNQKVIYSREQIQIEKKIVEKPLLTIPSNEVAQLVFDDAPASKVFAALERAYSIEILYDKELMNHCPLTATLGDEPLFEKLTVLCKAIEARYEIVDGKIIIHSNGCH